MNTWLQLAVAVVSLMAGGLGAYQQVRRRGQTFASGLHVNEKRPNLNGFTVVLRQALEQMDILRKENEQLRIRVAELEARATTRKSRSTSTTRPSHS